MVGVFRNAPSSLDGRPDVKTTADLFNWLKNALASLVPPKSAQKLEAAVAAELNAAFGSPSATKALDLAATKAELAKIGAALSQLR